MKYNHVARLKSYTDLKQICITFCNIFNCSRKIYVSIKICALVLKITTNNFETKIYEKRHCSFQNLKIYQLLQKQTVLNNFFVMCKRVYVKCINFISTFLIRAYYEIPGITRFLLQFTSCVLRLTLTIMTD